MDRLITTTIISGRSNYYHDNKWQVGMVSAEFLDWLDASVRHVLVSVSVSLSLYLPLSLSLSCSL